MSTTSAQVLYSVLLLSSYCRHSMKMAYGTLPSASQLNEAEREVGKSVSRIADRVSSAGRSQGVDLSARKELDIDKVLPDDLLVRNLSTEP